MGTAPDFTPFLGVFDAPRNMKIANNSSIFAAKSKEMVLTNFS